MVISKDLSKQSSRDKRTVEATRKPLLDQFFSKTSVSVLGCADVTAANTTSAPSSQRINTGLFCEDMPFVKGIDATQISPALISCYISKSRIIKIAKKGE